jgi:AcrR family transcriptional regulator
VVVAKADRSKMPEPVVTKGQKATRKDTLATRGRILDAAEQLFYQRGIDNVSLADINQAAGQKNRNALQYHFGDKTALLHAVLDRHSEQIAVKREAMVAELNAKGHFEIRDVVAVVIRPLAEKLEANKSGAAYIGINSQLASSHFYLEHFSRRSSGGYGSVEGLIKQCLPKLPAEIIRAREILAVTILFHSLAAALAQGADINRAVFVEALIDAHVAIMSQPPSVQTLAQVTT